MHDPRNAASALELRQLRVRCRLPNLTTVLERRHTLRETFALLRAAEKPAVSRFRFGSPCRFVRQIDMLVHIVLPEVMEDRWPKLAEYLRRTSPRWGRSWRGWPY